MARASTYRDRPHARIYAEWIELAAWRHLSGNAAKLLVAMLADYRPGRNGYLEWSERRAGRTIGKSAATGRRALEELQDRGWIEVERFGKFQRRDAPTLYALTVWPNDATGDPATEAFKLWKPARPLAATASKQRHG